MTSNAKSSITLPPAELKLVNALQAKLKAKSKVEVVRHAVFCFQRKRLSARAFAKRIAVPPSRPVAH